MTQILHISNTDIDVDGCIRKELKKLSSATADLGLAKRFGVSSWMTVY